MTDFELLSNRLRTLETKFRIIKVLAATICILIAGGGILAQVRFSVPLEHSNILRGGCGIVL